MIHSCIIVITAISSHSADGFPNATAEYLEGLGHVIQSRDRSFAVVQGVMVDQTGNVTAHADGRKTSHAVVTTVT